MQKTAYYCDCCRKAIGDKIHISLGLNKGLSGLAIPPDTYTKADEETLYASQWRIANVPSGFMHFHIECIEKYFMYWKNRITAEKKHGKENIKKRPGKNEKREIAI